MMYRAAAVQPAVGVIDPNLPGIYLVQDALQLSGLNVVRGEAGAPVVVSFTATSVGDGGAVADGADTITGAVVDQTSLIVATLGSATITVGPYGNSLSGGEYKAVTLTSVESLQSTTAGNTYTAWVGPASAIAAYAVGDYLPTDPTTMLSVTFTAGGTPVTSAGGGTGGFTAPPPTSQGGSSAGLPSASSILTDIIDHWQLVALGVGVLLVAPTVLNATANVESAENRLKAARKGAS